MQEAVACATRTQGRAVTFYLSAAPAAPATTSLWDKLLPALAAGVAGILAAAISATVALLIYRRTFRQNRELQSNQLAISLLPRRLDAFETIWVALYRIQRGDELTQNEADTLVKATVWVPADIRDGTARLLSSKDEAESAAIAQLRQSLLTASGTDEIDVAIARLRERKLR